MSNKQFKYKCFSDFLMISFNRNKICKETVMSKLENKIEAQHRCLFDVLNAQKYTVDYFQREYSWEQKHIEQLVTDLTTSFLNEYTQGDSRSDGNNYNNYYLGPFVVSIKEGGKRSIIDGQQRLTSLTLLLIYLNNLQKELNIEEKIEPMIFSEHRGDKSFNITVDERITCLNNLFTTGMYTIQDNDDASVCNMAQRYQNIVEIFPDELKNESFSFFIDWLKYNVIMVEIIAYSDENAYTIFETMNDRGLNLTPSDMLKGFLLSHYKNTDKRKKADDLWRKSMLRLHEYEKDEDLRFFQALLRAQYARTIRQGQVGAQNEDFEKIGTRFHSWVRDNLAIMNLNNKDHTSFERFIEQEFQFYLRAYLEILAAECTFTPALQHVYYIDCWGIAPTLSYPLMLAPLQLEDSSDVVRQKIDLVARYIELFAVLRTLNNRRFAASSIRYTMYTLVKEIRGKSLSELKLILSQKAKEIPEKFENFHNVGLYNNRNFIKFLLSRITAYIDNLAGINTTLETYCFPEQGKPFEIEHIWAKQFTQHQDEFAQEYEFENYRNKLGDLILLPKGTNQSYSDMTFEKKMPHYLKENLLAKSLCEKTYENNPNFTKLITEYHLPFKPHDQFKKADIDARQKLYQTICERIWNSQF